MEEGFYYHPLENIEDVELFYEAVERSHLTKAISPERPYTYWTIELYDQKMAYVVVVAWVYSQPILGVWPKK